ncbi:hypothetical protein GGX14DRAFT_453853 [Mycena pura]|uniref:Uncharacterized protein n=1 Tax=Mycena pura TaxID=153505 RepID=A0AAD6VFN8_9AGAR|nr:hypothetical protein GGX14DRAFT_453853 [Mycena pura]
MASSMSSTSSLHRGRTASIAGSRRPRARSPASLYVPYDTSIAKPPKPLIKLDKKAKNKPQTASIAAHVVVRSTASPPSSSTSTEPAGLPVRRRLSVASLFGPRSLGTPGAESAESGDHLDLQELQPMAVPPRLTHSDEAVLGRTAVESATEPASPSTLDPDHDFDTDSFFSTQFSDSDETRASSCQCATLLTLEDLSGESESSDASGFKCIEESTIKDSGCYRDDAYIQHDSALLSPVEPSVAVSTPHDGDDAVTPRTPPMVPRTDSHTLPRAHAHTHARHDSIPAARPDTPFTDRLIKVNWQGARAASACKREESRDGWIGEWNQGNMQDVIRKLRSLR